MRATYQGQARLEVQRQGIKFPKHRETDNIRTNVKEQGPGGAYREAEVRPRHSCGEAGLKRAKEERGDGSGDPLDAEGGRSQRCRCDIATSKASFWPQEHMR